jgi:cytochrome c-type biogenesis protein CcsB
MRLIAHNLALVGYIFATGLSLTYLIQRDELVHRLGTLARLGGWAAHTIALIALAVETGQPPLGTLPDAISMAVWVIVLLDMWVERQWSVKALGAFVLPIAVVLSLNSAAATQGGFPEIAPTLRSTWIWVHIALALIGIAAFVLNFAGATMYLLQERQLKGKRPGPFYYRLPPLETLDRLSYRTLALGFPFLTTGLILGALWAESAWGSVFTFDPLAALSFVAWAIYATVLAGRATAGWHGRRAAYVAIVGFMALVLTLGAGLFLPGRHG